MIYKLSITKKTNKRKKHKKNLLYNLCLHFLTFLYLFLYQSKETKWLNALISEICLIAYSDADLSKVKIKEDFARFWPTELSEYIVKNIRNMMNATSWNWRGRSNAKSDIRH